MSKKYGRPLLVAFALLLCAEAAQAQWMWTPQTGRWINLRRLPKETPALQLEYARQLMLEGKIAQAKDETDKFYKYYADSDLADNNQFLRAEILLEQGKLTSAAESLQTLLVSYPESELYDEAIAKQYEIGDALFEAGKEKMERRYWRPFKGRTLKRAADVYTMVIDNRPFTEEAAEAQYKVGLVQFTRGAYLTATYEYNRVIGDYPASQWVPEAMHGLAECYYAMALPPEYDQEPSMLAVQKIDDFAGRYPTDARAAELQDKRVEMLNNIAEQRLGTARFYEKRRNFEAAAIYYQVVVEEYPGTPAAEEAQSWLDDRTARQAERQEKS
jgi:outer membrane protein assembly factor BamD